MRGDRPSSLVVCSRVDQEPPPSYSTPQRSARGRWMTAGRERREHEELRPALKSSQERRRWQQRLSACARQGTNRAVARKTAQTESWIKQRSQSTGCSRQTSQGVKAVNNAAAYPAALTRLRIEQKVGRPCGTQQAGLIQDVGRRRRSWRRHQAVERCDQERVEPTQRPVVPAMNTWDKEPVLGDTRCELRRL